jgi:hypothetical protein
MYKTSSYQTCDMVGLILIWTYNKYFVSLQIIIEGIIGFSYTSDIALDDLALVDGNCQSKSKQPSHFFGFLFFKVTLGSNRFFWQYKAITEPQYK